MKKKIYYFGKSTGFFLMATGIIWGMLHDARQGLIIGLAGLSINMVTMLFRPNLPRLFRPDKLKNTDSAYNPYDIDAFWPRKRK